MKSRRKGRPAGSAARPRQAIAPAVGTPPGRPSQKRPAPRRRRPDPAPPTRWGAAVDALRIERGWTRGRLAAESGVRPTAITDIIRHAAPATTTTLLKLAAALEVDVAELLMTPEARQDWRRLRLEHVGRS